MIVKALTAGALIVTATAARPLTVHPDLGTMVVARPMVAADPLPEPPVVTAKPAIPTASAPISEPAGWLLLIAGFGIVGLVHRASVRTLTA